MLSAASPRALARGSLAALAMTLASVGCQRAEPSPSYAEPSVPSATVPFAAGFLDGIAWLNDGRIVFGYRAPEDVIGGETHLWSVRRDGSWAGPVEIDTGAKCTWSETLAPLALADGQLSYQLRCAPGSRGPFSEKTSLLGVDASGHSIALMPLIDLHFIPRQAAFAPDNREGLLGGGSAICEGIVRVDQSGTHPLRLAVTNGGRSFDLGEFDPTADCDSTGNADFPAWSRDGHTIAYFASTAAIGASGPSRLDAPWALCVAAAEMTDARAIVERVEDPAGRAWSPDSRWLVFAQRRRSPGAVDHRGGNRAPRPDFVRVRVASRDVVANRDAARHPSRRVAARRRLGGRDCAVRCRGRDLVVAITCDPKPGLLTDH
jgi:hypothetical protein